jgi:hypothetical protein
MVEQFDAILVEVMKELGQEWYEVVDGDGFALVKERCSAMLGCDCYENKEFSKWAEQLFDDL